MTKKSFLECIRTRDIQGNPSQWVEKWLTDWKLTWGEEDGFYGQDHISIHFGMSLEEWRKFVNRPNCLLSPRQIGSIGITTPEEDALAHLHSRLDDFFPVYDVEDYVEVVGEGLSVFEVIDVTGHSARLVKGGFPHGWENFSKLTKINYRVLEHSYHRQSAKDFHLDIVAWDKLNDVFHYRVEYDRGTISIRRSNAMGEAIYFERGKELIDFQRVVHQFFDFSHLKKFLTITSLDFKDPDPEMEDLGMYSASLTPQDPWVAKGIHPLTRKETTFSLILKDGTFKLTGEDGTIYLENYFGGDCVDHDYLMGFFGGKIYFKIS